jgi:hypothetical protein
MMSSGYADGMLRVETKGLNRLTRITSLAIYEPAGTTRGVPYEHLELVSGSRTSERRW